MIRVLVNVLSVACIGAAAIAAVVIWPRAFEGVLPASMLQGLAGMQADPAPEALSFDSRLEPAMRLLSVQER